MDFDDAKTRLQILQVMKKVELSLRDDFRKRLREILTPAERKVQAYVDHLAFKEGAWYRPLHNIIVTACMIAICKHEKLPRDLVYVAQLHDTGNAIIKIKDTQFGADWENVDKRRKHQEISAQLAKDFLGKLSIKPARIAQLVSYIAEHDAPYLGEKLTNDESKACRSADKCFVPAALSWIKDIISHYADDKYIQRAKELGIIMSPKNFLLARLACFYDTESKLPDHWDKAKFPLRTELAPYNEHGQELCYNATQQKITDFMFTNRIKEYELMLKAVSINEFKDIFKTALKTETNALIDFAAGKSFSN